MLGAQFGSAADILSLFALGMGYVVLYFAKREDNAT